VTGEIVQVSGIVGTALVVRYVTQLIVIVWSLRADEPGRRHAIRLLELLRGTRRERRRPP
jgi:hypothetical protein